MVETGGLENRFALTGNGGSNPSPSAIYFIIIYLQDNRAMKVAFLRQFREINFGNVTRETASGLLERHRSPPFSDHDLFSLKG